MLAGISDGVADPDQLTILTTALNDYCRLTGIEPGSADCEDVGRLLLSIFKGGGECSTQALAAAMNNRYAGKR